jgi:hypothetical protein
MRRILRKHVEVLKQSASRETFVSATWASIAASSNQCDAGQRTGLSAGGSCRPRLFCFDVQSHHRRTSLCWSLKQNLETSQLLSATRTLVRGERCGAGEAVHPQQCTWLTHVCTTVDRQIDSRTCIRPCERISVSARDTDGRLAFDAHINSKDTYQAQVSLPHHIAIHTSCVSVQTRAHSHFFCTKHCRHCRIHLSSSEACAQFRAPQTSSRCDWQCCRSTSPMPYLSAV